MIHFEFYDVMWCDDFKSKYDDKIHEHSTDTVVKCDDKMLMISNAIIRFEDILQVNLFCFSWNAVW